MNKKNFAFIVMLSIGFVCLPISKTKAQSYLKYISVVKDDYFLEIKPTPVEQLREEDKTTMLQKGKNYILNCLDGFGTIIAQKTKGLPPKGKYWTMVIFPTTPYGKDLTLNLQIGEAIYNFELESFAACIVEFTTPSEFEVKSETLDAVIIK
jgi:hypothetical protein